MTNQDVGRPVEQCAYCGEPAGPGDWASRQWGLIEEPGPGGVPVVHHVHAPCYLHRLRTRTHPNTARFRPAR